MSFFEPLETARADAELPRRVYARVDETSTDRRPSTTLFDVVDADWLDDFGREPGSLTEPAAAREAASFVSTLVADIGTTRAQEGAIAEIAFASRLAAGASDGGVIQFPSLLGPGTPRTIDRMTWKDRKEAREIARVGSLAGVPRGPVAKIGRALSLPGDVQAVAVYDVGQGACTATIVEDCPAVYFDFGLGCDMNSHTAPAALDDLCLCREPTIVLSHFHHDHWAAVARFPAALASTWIVPDQGESVAFSHATLLGRIRERGELLVWPAAEVRLAGGDGRVELLNCGGTHRNDSGLACVVRGADGGRVLLPADARYKHVPLVGGPVRSLVVAHHGGRTSATLGEIPVPDGSLAGRLVYSYGPGNAYGHPLALSRDRHRQVWGPDHLATADRDRAGLGHVHVYWNDADAAVGRPHGAVGAQRPVQR